MYLLFLHVNSGEYGPFCFPPLTFMKGKGIIIFLKSFFLIKKHLLIFENHNLELQEVINIFTLNSKNLQVKLTLLLNGQKQINSTFTILA